MEKYTHNMQIVTSIFEKLVELIEARLADIKQIKNKQHNESMGQFNTS